MRGAPLLAYDHDTRKQRKEFIMKKFLASALAVTSIFAAIGFAACGDKKDTYVATPVQSDNNEQYGLAVGKNSSNKAAILSAMNTVIAELNIDDIITHYTALSNGETSSITLDYPDLSDNTAGTLNVYTNAEFAPFEFRNDKQEIVGVDMYIMELVAEEMNMKVKFNDIAFDAIVGKIVEEDNAIGAAGMTIYDEPKEKVDFSDPYFSTVQCIISEKEQAFATLEALKGKKIGVQKGTTGWKMVSDAISEGVLKNTGAEVIAYDNGPIAYTALKAGKCDVVVIDELPAKKLVK